MATLPPDPMLPLKHPQHRACFVCSPDHPSGLRVRFFASGEHEVEGAFSCDPSFEGYPGRIHGGVIAALLDGAMVHCLWAHGIEAYTADLQVRFLLPVEVGVEARVEAELVELRGPLLSVVARVSQGGQLKARARARFAREGGALDGLALAMLGK